MIIVANWKAYVADREKSRKLFSVARQLARATKHSIVLAPPAPLLGMLASQNRSPVEFAAQDISATTGGALTGEATAQSFQAAGARYALIGHSERRAQGDTERVIADKLSRAFAHQLIPILCVGEKERDPEGRYLSFIREELTAALTSIAPRERARVIIAYEPLWAIGLSADFSIGGTDLAEMVLYIRKVLSELVPEKNAARIPILYGGSVEPGNIRSLAGSSSVDGFLIGHASADPYQFSILVKEIS